MVRQVLNTNIVGGDGGTGLSDDDLTKKLAEDTESLEEAEDKETPDGETDDDQDHDGSADGEDEESEEEKDDSGSDEEADNPGTVDDEYSKLSKEELVERLKKTKKQVDDKEKYIQDRKAKIAALQRQLTEDKQKLSEEKTKVSDPDFKEKFFDDPKEGFKELQKEEDKNKRLAELHEQEFRLENENFIIDRVDPNFNDKLDDMVEVLVKDMKVPKETAIAFRNDPFYYRREILVDLVRRVELKRKDVEIAKLKKKPTDILDRIEKLSGKKPLKPSSLKKRNLGEDEEEIDNSKIANLDDKALQKYLEEGKE